MLALLNVLWAPVNFAVQTATSNGMSPATVATLRWCTLAFALFGLLAIPSFRRLTKAAWPSGKDAAKATLFGALTFAPAHLLYYTALRHTSTVEGTVLGTTSPIWTAMFAFILLRERVDSKRIVAIVLGFCGAWIVGVGFALPQLHAGHTTGNALYLTAVFLETTTAVFTARLIRRSSGVTILAFQALGTVPTMLLAPALLPKVFSFSIGHANLAAWTSVGYLVLVPGLLCFAVWYRMVERFPLSLMVVTLMLQPPLSAIVGWRFLGEKITTNLVVGTVAILAALLVGASERTSGATAAGEVADDEQDQHDGTSGDQTDVSRRPVGFDRTL